MKRLASELNKISGGRVLDLATRYGEFAFKLKEGLRDYTEIIAGDCSQEVVREARLRYPHCGICFQVMHGEHIDEPDESFDTVCISNSLHHMEHVEAVLKEMYRLLKPGGHFIVNEMFSDDQSPAQQTHVLLHTLGGEIDTFLGEYHGKTGTKNEIIHLTDSLPLKHVKIFEDHESDPIWDEKLAAKVSGIQKKVEKISRMPQYEECKARAAKIEELYNRNGIKRCTQLVIMGIK